MLPHQLVFRNELEGRSKGLLSELESGPSDGRAALPPPTIEVPGGAERPVCPLTPQGTPLDVDAGTIRSFALTCSWWWVTAAWLDTTYLDKL